MVECYICNDETENGNKFGIVYANVPLCITLINNKQNICSNCVKELLINLHKLDNITEERYDLSSKISVYEKLLKIQDHVELYDTIRTNHIKLKRLKWIIDKV